MAKPILKILAQQSDREARRIIADLWEEWPGDDPTLLHDVVLDWLQNFAIESALKELSDLKLVTAANDEADDFYCDLIQKKGDDLFHQLDCRKILTRGLLNIAGADLSELRLRTGWHDLVVEALRYNIVNRNTLARHEN